MTVEEECNDDPSSNDENNEESEGEIDWKWIDRIKPQKLKGNDLKKLAVILSSWKPSAENERNEEYVVRLLKMYELAVCAMTKEKEAFTDRSSELEKENKDLKNQIKRLRKTKSGQSDEALEDIMQLEKELARINRENDQLERELERERAAKENIESKFEGSEKDRRNLKREVEELRDQVMESHRSAAGEEDAEMNAIEQKKVRELEDSIRMKNKQIHQLLEDVESVEKDCSSYRETISNLRDRLSEATSQINAMTGEYVSMKESVRHYDGLLDGLQGENARLQRLVEDAHAEKRERDISLEKLGQKVDERLEKMVKRIEHKDAEIEELRARLNRANVGGNGYRNGNDIDERKENTAFLIQAVKDREEQIEELKADLACATEEIKKSTVVIEDLKGHKVEGKGQLGPLQKSLIDLRTQLHSANERISELEVDVSEATKAAEEKSRDLTEAIAQLRMYERGEYGLEQAVEQCKTVTAQLKERDRELETMTRSYNETQYQNSELLDENSAMREKLGMDSRSSEESPNSRKAKSTQHKALLQAMQREVERLEDERLCLKTENRKLTRLLGAKLNASDLDNIQKEQFFSETKSEYNDKERISVELKDEKRKCQDLERELADLKAKHGDVLLENNGLRTSMQEILDSVRSQDAKSDVQIKSESLDKILSILDARHLWGCEYHPTMELKTRIEKLEGANEELRNQLRRSRQEENRLNGLLMQNKLQITNVDSPNLNEEQTEKSLIHSEAVTSSEIVVKLNNQLIHVLDQLHEKEEQNKNLHNELEEFHRNLGTHRHQLGLLYEEYRESIILRQEESRKWKQETTGKDEELEKLRVKIRELESHYDVSKFDDPKIVETVKRIALLSSNEAIMIRKYRAIEESEKWFRRECSELKKESVQIENRVIQKIGILERFKEMASYKIEDLQKCLNNSVPLKDLHSANHRYSELTEKYRDLLQREQIWSGQGRKMEELDMEMKTIKDEKNGLAMELISAKERLHSLEAILSSKTDSGSNIEEETVRNQWAKQITMLEMKELNERQRADHIENQCKSIQTQLQQMEKRNEVLEETFKKMTQANMELQKTERELYEKLATSVSKEEFDKLYEKLRNLESSENSLKLECDQLREVANVATNQIEIFERKQNDENLEIELLRHQVIDLQTRTDEKAIIGKLHRQIISLQLKENDTVQKFQTLQTKLTKTETQLFRQYKISEKYENMVIQLRQDMYRKSLDFTKFIQDLRRRYAGSIPLSKQENMTKTLMEMYEEKRKIHRYLRELDEQKLQAEILTGELKIKLRNLDETDVTNKRMCDVQDLQVKELKARLRSERLDVEVRHLRELNESQSSQIDRLELDLLQAETMLDNRIYTVEMTKPLDEITMEMNEEMTNLKGSTDLPISQQLEQCMKSFRDSSKTVEKYKRNALEAAKVCEELRKKIRELENSSNAKDKIINDLRLRMPNTVDRALAVATATSGLHFETTLSGENHENHQALKIAQTTIESLRERLKQKEETVHRYETLVKEIRHESEEGVERKNQEIHTLQSTIRKQQRAFNELKSSPSGVNIETDTSVIVVQAKRMQELENEILEYQRTTAELTNKVSSLRTDCDNLKFLAESRLNEIRNLTQRINDKRKKEEQEESEILKQKVEALKDENSMLRDLQITNADKNSKKTMIDKLQLELSEKDRKMKAMGRALAELKEDMIQAASMSEEKEKKKTTNEIPDSISATFSMEAEELKQKIDKLTEKNEKLMKIVKDLRGKDATFASEIRSLKEEIGKKDSLILRLKRGQANSTDFSVESEALRGQIKALEGQLASLNRAERPLEDNQTEENETNRIKTVEELARWNESKKWQSRLETLKQKLKEADSEVAKVSRANTGLRDTISRLERDVLMTKSKVKILTSKNATNDSRVSELIRENSDLKTELENLYKKRSDGTKRNSNNNNEAEEEEEEETMKLKNKLLHERIESQERKIVALELTKKCGTKDEEEEILKRWSEVRREKFALMEQISTLKSENDRIKQNSHSLLLQIRDMVQKRMDHDVISGKINENLKVDVIGTSEKTKFPQTSNQRSQKSFINDQLMKLKTMNEDLIRKVEARDAQIRDLESRLLKKRAVMPASTDMEDPKQDEEGKKKTTDRIRVLEQDLQRKSDLLGEIKVLLKQAANREREQLSQNEELKRKCDLLLEVDPKTPSEILAKELRQTRLTVERLICEKKELEFKLHIFTTKEEKAKKERKST